MKTLHIAPSDSAGGSLREAIEGAGRDDEVLAFRDDLSCGPIDPDDPAVRGAWWARYHSDSDAGNVIAAFWNRIATTEDRLVVWFGRNSASELAFFLAMADRLADRPYDVVEVAGEVSIVSKLGPLLGSARPTPTEMRAEARQRWRCLKAENAAFRVVTPAGLVSAPIDHFDSRLIEKATTEWQRVILIVHETFFSFDPYRQVGDVMLRARLVALVEAGRLLADGDPWDMRSTRVRLPG